MESSSDVDIRRLYRSKSHSTIIQFPPTGNVNLTAVSSQFIDENGNLVLQERVGNGIIEHIFLPKIVDLSLPPDDHFGYTTNRVQEQSDKWSKVTTPQVSPKNNESGGERKYWAVRDSNTEKKKIEQNPSEYKLAEKKRIQKEFVIKKRQQPHRPVHNRSVSVARYAQILNRLQRPIESSREKIRKKFKFENAPNGKNMFNNYTMSGAPLSELLKRKCIEYRNKPGDRLPQPRLCSSKLEHGGESKLSIYVKKLDFADYVADRARVKTYQKT